MTHCWIGSAMHLMSFYVINNKKYIIMIIII